MDYSHEKVVVVGLGETGAPLLDLIGEKCQCAWGYDINPKKSAMVIPEEPTVMNINIPFSHTFIEEVLTYIDNFDPHLVLIHSTVLPGTTMHIWKGIQDKGWNTLLAYSPIRGNIRDGMKWGLKTYTKFVGGCNYDSTRRAVDFLSWLGMKIYITESPFEAEWAKLFETTYYGVCLGWFQEMRRICKKFGLRYEDIEEFIRTIESDSNGKVERPLYKNVQIIGGHCVIPNAELLLKIYDSEFVRALINSNNKAKEEYK